MQTLFTEVDSSQNDRDNFEDFDESKQYAGIALDVSNATSYKKQRPGPGGLDVTQVPVADPHGSKDRTIIKGKNFKWSEVHEQFVETDEAQIEILSPSPKQEKSKTPKGKRGKALQAIIETSTDEMVVIPTFKVSLQGVFGKFTGKYVDALIQDKLLVLVQEAEEDGFVPPESEDNTIKVSWIDVEGEPQIFEAYYLGMTFTSKILGKTSYIFHLIGA